MCLCHVSVFPSNTFRPVKKKKKKDVECLCANSQGTLCLPVAVRLLAGIKKSVPVDVRLESIRSTMTGWIRISKE